MHAPKIHQCKMPTRHRHHQLLIDLGQPAHLMIPIVFEHLVCTIFHMHEIHNDIYVLIIYSATSIMALLFQA